MYAVLVPGQTGGFNKPSVVNDMDQALDLAAAAAKAGGHPRIFQEVQGQIVLTAKLVTPTSGEADAAPSNGHPVRTPATIIPTSGKRSTQDLSKLRARVLSYVMTNPEQNVETISRSLQVPTKELVLPIRQLLTEKKLRKKGVARAVKYLPPLPAKTKKAA